jgi:hypothetical protein
MNGHSAICQHEKVYEQNLDIEDFSKISSFCPLEDDYKWTSNFPVGFVIDVICHPVAEKGKGILILHKDNMPPTPGYGEQ